MIEFDIGNAYEQMSKGTGHIRSICNKCKHFNAQVVSLLSSMVIGTPGQGACAANRNIICSNRADVYDCDGFEAYTKKDLSDKIKNYTMAKIDSSIMNYLQRKEPDTNVAFLAITNITDEHVVLQFLREYTQYLFKNNKYNLSKVEALDMAISNLSYVAYCLSEDLATVKIWQELFNKHDKAFYFNQIGGETLYKKGICSFEKGEKEL